MKTNHTPGKWVVHSTGTLEHKFEVHPEMDVMGEYPIADIHGELDVAEANAHLIAAAPTMMHELQHIVERIRAVRPNDSFCSALADRAQEVIHKAKGEK